MPAVQINLWGVLAATAFSMIVGVIWYSVPVFGKKWMKLIGKSAEELQKQGGQIYLLTALLWLLVSYVMAHAVQYIAADTWIEGAVTGFWAWAGFAFTTNTIHALFQGQSKQLLGINLGYSLVALVGSGMILVLLPN